MDRNVPIDFKVSNPMGCFQHLNRLQFPGGRKPKYVGQAMAPPPWWRQTEIMTAFDKIMADKVCLDIHHVDLFVILTNLSTRNLPYFSV